MPTFFYWQWNRSAMSALVSSPEVSTACKEAAEKIAESARNIAPVGRAGAPQYDPHPGRYKAAIQCVPSGTGRDGRRRYSVVVDLPYAAAVEAKHGVLHKAMKMHQIK